MRIIISDSELLIPEQLYKTAEKIGDLIIRTIAAQSQAKKQIPLYYAIIIALHKRSGEILSAIDTDDIRVLFNSWTNKQLRHVNDNNE